MIQKKGIVFMAMLLCALTATAQEHSVGLQLGFASPIYRLNTPTEMGKSKTYLQSTTLNGLKVGLVYDATLIKGFGFSMGLNYTYAMHNEDWKDYKETYLPIQYKTEYRYHQGEVFVDWQYKFEIAKQTYVILYSGPTIQCLFELRSKDYYKVTIDDPIQIKYIDSYESTLDDRVQRLNVTWGLGAGFQYKRYFLRGGYDFGLINPYSKQQFSDYGYLDDDRLTRGRLDQWQIKLGVYFWQSDED